MDTGQGSQTWYSEISTSRPASFRRDATQSAMRRSPGVPARRGIEESVFRLSEIRPASRLASRRSGSGPDAGEDAGASPAASRVQNNATARAARNEAWARRVGVVISPSQSIDDDGGATHTTTR